VPRSSREGGFRGDENEFGRSDWNFFETNFLGDEWRKAVGIGSSLTGCGKTYLGSMSEGDEILWALTRDE
jgi:hypothetical protein